MRRHSVLAAFLLAVLGLALAACSPDKTLYDRDALLASGYEKVTIAGGELKNGIYDVSVEYGDDHTGWMAYSLVEFPSSVETHLAKTTDFGKTWTHVVAINQTEAGSIDEGGTKRDGVWRFETPSLLFDSGDVAARRWKLFVQRYFMAAPYQDADRRYGSGWVEVRYAERPDGPWSTPVRLFGKEEAGCRLDLNTLGADLDSTSFYNEIGSVAVGGTIFLSLDASPTASGLDDWPHHKIALVSSADHGESWGYAGTLTTYADATSFGYLVLTASSLVREKGRNFLLVSPAGALRKSNKNHDGMLVFEVADLATARLVRDADGRPVVVKQFPRYLDDGGEGDYDEGNTSGGVLLPQADSRASPDVLQVYSTKQPIVDP